MRIALGKNIAAMRAQRELSSASSAVAKVTEQLASGKRINRASDDAADLSVSTSLQTSGRLYGRAIDSINQGISALNIMDEAMTTLGSIVTRIRELAEQSANGALSSNQRVALDDEAQALHAEFDRIAASTSYNGVALLDGSTRGFTVQVGITSERLSRMNVAIGSPINRLVGTGTFSFSQDVAAATGARQNDTVLIDFNGDGALDIVSNADTGGGLSLSIGNGDGTFGAYTTLATSTSGSAVGADFTGDGRPDIVRVRFDGIRLETNVGGSSVTGSTISALTNIRVNAADFNNDGNIDLFGRDITTGESIDVYLSNGDGTFQSPITTSGIEGDIQASITAADFNGDGILDLIAPGSGTTMTLLLGNGDGTFAAGTPVNKLTGGSIASVTAGDFNGDGMMDVAYARSGTGAYVSLGNGDGTFQTGTTLTSSHLGSITAADLNQDGRDDIVAGSSTGTLEGDLVVFMANASGSFGALTSYTGPTSSNAVRGIQTGDLNGDGVLDVVAATYYGNSTTVWLADTVYTSNLTVSLLTQDSSRSALEVTASVSQDLAGTQSSIVTYRNRLTSLLNTTIGTRDYVKAADSRITDVDVADATASYYRQSLKQQFAASIIARANINLRIALSLLEN